MKNNPAQFLRNVLRLDALTCLLSGVASLALGRVLSEPLGLSTELLHGSGAALLAVAAFIAFAAKNPAVLRWPVWIVVLGNAVWVLDSVLVLVGRFEHPTALGTAYVIAQALVVTGLRKTSATPVIAARN
jgi:hypothetical protein